MMFNIFNIDLYRKSLLFKYIGIQAKINDIYVLAYCHRLKMNFRASRVSITTTQDYSSQWDYTVDKKTKRDFERIRNYIYSHKEKSLHLTVIVSTINAFIFDTYENCNMLEIHKC